MRAIHRIRVDGTCAAADRLREYLHRYNFVLVPDSSYGFRLTVETGERLTIDSIDSPLERRILDLLQEKDREFPGIGQITVQRAGGNQDPRCAVLTVPDDEQVQLGVALAVVMAISQISEQIEPAPDTPAARRAPSWWRRLIGAIILTCFAVPVAAQTSATPFWVADADTGAGSNPRIYVGLFAPSSGGPTAVALPTTLGTNDGFKVDCVNGCSAATTDTDDASIATGQSVSLSGSLGMAYDGSVWRRLTFGTAGTESAQVWTVQGIASGTPVIVGDGAGALNTIIDSGTVTTVSTVTSLSQFAGAAINLGSGTIGTGTLRVNIATDDPVNDAAVETSATIGTTAAAVPASATQIGGTDGTNLVVPYIDPCQREARTVYVVDIVTATTTEIANAVASEFFYLCSVSLFSAGTQNVAIVEDDTDACTSPTAGLNGGVTAAEGYNFTAQTGIVTGTGSNWVMKTATANRYMCIITSAAVQLSGTITFVSAP